ncbi:BACON domain-containing protein [Winogradskyella pulchriflava]|uniref:BACON domain-containing protein n=1 Tax=Winogradskyella pulchriflava TaxID=1110688 RepID=A0ABV6QCD2_9FLAO
MSFNPPSPIAFNYQQYYTPLSQTVTYDISSELFVNSASQIETISMPPWLIMSNPYFVAADDKIYFTLSVNTTYAFTMAEGNYSDNIKLRFKVNIPVFGTITVTSDNYLVQLEVIHTTQLTLTPSVLPFSYLVGGSNPQNQTLSIASDSNWNIVSSQSWVTLSQANGYGSASVFVGVNPAGLTVGDYQAILQVTDGLGIPRVATVTLLVTEGDTEDTYLYVSPGSLQFISELEVENTTEKTITIEASDAWTLTSSEAWCVVSASSGTSGISTVTVTVDSDELTDTTVPYLSEIVFVSEGIQKTVFVELIIVPFLLDGITSETLYYADDRNKLQVTNVFPNMFLYIEAIASNGASNHVYKLSAPYQNGLAKQLIGMETNALLKSVIPTATLTTRVIHSINPVNININAYNKAQFSGATTALANYTNLQFLTGTTPSVTNKICYTPAILNLTKDAVISLSAVNLEEAPTQIVVTGSDSGTFTTSIANDLTTYNAILNLADLDLSAGDQIEVAWAGFTTTINIKDNAIEQTIIAFENEWKKYEFFECTGFLTETPTAKTTTTEVQDEGNKHTKVVTIDSGVEYTLNTGYIYTQAEYDWLARILESKHIYIYRNGAPVEIILSTKNLETYKTKTHYRSYNLKFTKAIIK